MELWTGFLLGLAGSLHCAGMCGPLALALPVAGHSRASLLAGRVAYNLGRIATYCALGAAFGLAGESLELAGLQRWVSLVAGAAVLIGLFGASRPAFTAPVARAANCLKVGLASLLRRRTISSLLGVGALNGLLPCGLVYAACAGAAASGSAIRGLEYLLVFGLGTVPMMLAISLAGSKLQFALRFKLQRLIPVSLALVGVLLVLRGLSLGIPYLSPDVSCAHGQCSFCN